MSLEDNGKLEDTGEVEDSTEYVHAYVDKYLHDITLELMVNKSRMKQTQQKTDNRFDNVESIDIRKQIVEMTHELLSNYNENDCTITNKFGDKIMEIFNTYINNCSQFLINQ